MDEIYHYTSIDNLELILKHKTLRLNSLKNVDDLDEGQSRDLGRLAPYIFASSWTYDNNENICLWNMYVRGKPGVRLGAPANFLTPTKNTKGMITNHTNTNAICYSITYEDNIDPCSEGYSPFDYHTKDSFFSPVIYNDDLTFNVTKNYMGMINDNLGRELGLIKNTGWNTQKECRYSVLATPKHYIPKHIYSNDETGHECFGAFLTTIFNLEPTDLDHIDFVLHQDKLNALHFLLGPNTTDIELENFKEKIQLLLPNHKGTIEKSRLRIRH